jgi:uncharacterized surface protein with fasciclin (FAS1) repeats
MKHSRKYRIASIAVAGSLIFTACSDDTEPVATGQTEDPAPVTDAADTDDAMTDDEMAEGEMTEESRAEGETAESMALEPTGPGCAAVPADGEGSFGGMADDPAATAASNNPLLSTLVAAVGEAGLVDTLNGEGPFTIFAPVNDAFAAIPEADLAAVLADTELLTGILTYHVIGGEKLSSADLVEAGAAQTVNGAELTFSEGSGGLEVNGAATLCMDVPTANATVHIIDTVLMPGA